MSKVFTVAQREFSTRVRSRGFIIGSIAVPVAMLFFWFIGGVFTQTEAEQAAANLPQEPLAGAVGYVDQAGIIQQFPENVPADVFTAYPTLESAEGALAAGEIQAFYVIPPDYLDTGDLQRVSPEIPTGPPDQDLFEWLLISNLVPDAGAREVARLRSPLGAGLEYVSLSGQAEEAQPAGMNFAPFIVSMVILFPLFTSGGYLLQSLAQEKSNRIMEVLLVSLRPRQLLLGKLIGLGGLTLVQYGIWIGVVLLALLVSGLDLSQLLAGIDLSMYEMLWILPFAFGGYLLYSALMAGIGALSPDIEGGRTWIFILTLPMMLPIYFWLPITSNPDGPLAVILSLFPFSAPVAMVMRMTTGAIPGWQIAFSLGLLLLTGLGVVLIMARLFRVQTLLSGEAISVRRFWNTVRSGSPAG